MIGKVAGCGHVDGMVDTPKLAIKSLLATPHPPDLGPGPRTGIQPVSAIDELTGRVVRDLKLGRDVAELVRSLSLLWHDHLDEAHSIVQNIETADGSLVHGIMHRREPDYGNANYWFHRTGRHPVFAGLGKRAVALLGVRGADLLGRRLTPQAVWDAIAFVDVCAETAGRPGRGSQEGLLRELQQIESETLLEYFLGNRRLPDQS